MPSADSTPWSAAVARAVATVCGLGDHLPIPGTLAGSLPAATAWWIACVMLPSAAWRVAATAAAALVATLVGTWAAGVEARRRGRGDPGPVVVDEVAGQWITLLPAALLVAPGGAVFTAATVAGFLLFRVFDVIKPWPVRELERLPGGVGIMADDLAAGVLAGLVLGAVLLWLA